MQTKEYRKQWYEKNKEHIHAYMKKYRGENRDKVRKWDTEYKLRNVLKLKKRRRRAYLQDYLHHAELGRLRQQGYKKYVLGQLGGFCFCCGENEIDFLTLEHLKGDGNVHRASGKHIYLDVIKEGFPKDRYGVLCMNCNFARRFGKKCPHQKALLEMLA